MSTTCRRCGKSLRVKDSMFGSKLCKICAARVKELRRSPNTDRNSYIKANLDALLATELKQH